MSIEWPGLEATNQPYYWAMGCVLLLAFASGIAESWRPARAQTLQHTQRVLINFGLGLTNFAIASALPFSASMVLEWASASGIGLLNVLAAPFWLAMATTIAAMSLASYGVHRLLHHVPLFWRIHRVHHCDREMDLSTALRHHPLEMLLVMALTLPFMVALGLNSTTVLVLGVADLAADIFTHINLALPVRLRRRLAAVLITPEMHALHHSAFQPDTDSNFGRLFSGWDRLFATLRDQSSTGTAHFALGLDDISSAKADSLAAMLLNPLEPASESARYDSGPLAFRSPPV